METHAETEPFPQAVVMFGRILLFSLAGVLASGLVAQEPGPCPKEVQRADGTERLCSLALPLDGKLLLTTAKGEFCICSCGDIMNMTVKELAAARALRDSTEAENFNRYIKYFKAGDAVWLDTALVSVLLGSDTVRTDVLDGAWLCDVDRRVIDIIEEIRNMELPFSGNLEFLIEKDLTDSPFPYFNRDAGAQGTVLNGWIHIPRRFLDDAAVGEELITFMLLHEIGHFMRDSDEEGEADEWASFEGSPEFLGCSITHNRRKAFLNNVDAQLRAYLLSIYPDDIAFLPDRCGSNTGLHCYPSADCRTMRIRSGLTMSVEGDEFGYRSACWASPVDLVLDKEWKPTRPCLEPVCRPRKPCKWTPWVCLFQDKLWAVFNEMPYLQLAGAAYGPHKILYNDAASLNERSKLVRTLLRRVDQLSQQTKRVKAHLEGAAQTGKK